MNNFRVNDQPWSGVTELRILLPQSKGNETHIFANGRNRVAVDVYIQGTDSKNNQVLVPSDILFQHTWLIDYNTGEKLTRQAEEDNFTWSYTDEANEFAMTPNVSSFTNEVHHGNLKLSWVRLYIYCSPAAVRESKKIAVLVEAPDKENYSSGYGKPFDEFIMLTANEEIHYKLPHIKQERGSFVSQHSIPGHENASWEQTNIYVSLEIDDIYGKRRITKLEHSGAPLSDVHQLYHDDNGYRYYYAHFLWPLGEKTTVSIGNTQWFELPITFPIDIEIRQEDGSICFTIMVVGDPTFPKEQDEWYADFIITLYDQYGNKGKFFLIPNNYDNTRKQSIYFAEV